MQEKMETTNQQQQQTDRRDQIHHRMREENDREVSHHQQITGEKKKEKILSPWTHSLKRTLPEHRKSRIESAHQHFRSKTEPQRQCQGPGLLVPGQFLIQDQSPVLGQIQSLGPGQGTRLGLDQGQGQGIPDLGLDQVVIQGLGPGRDLGQGIGLDPRCLGLGLGPGPIPDLGLSNISTKVRRLFPHIVMCLK